VAAAKEAADKANFEFINFTLVHGGIPLPIYSIVQAAFGIGSKEFAGLPPKMSVEEAISMFVYGIKPRLKKDDPYIVIISADDKDGLSLTLKKKDVDVTNVAPEDNVLGINFTRAEYEQMIAKGFKDDEENNLPIFFLYVHTDKSVHAFNLAASAIGSE
jgi:hypothetical protein